MATEVCLALLISNREKARCFYNRYLALVWRLVDYCGRTCRGRPMKYHSKLDLLKCIRPLLTFYSLDIADLFFWLSEAKELVLISLKLYFSL